MTYTIEEIEKIRTLIDSFEAFLSHLDISHDGTAVARLVSDDRDILLHWEDIPIVEAYVAWMMEYYSDKTMLWMSKLQRDAHEARDHIEDISHRLGKLGSGAKRQGSVTQYVTGGQCFYRKTSEEAGRGMSLSLLVLHGDPKSRLHRNVRFNLMPVIWAGTRGRIIEIVQSDR